MSICRFGEPDSLESRLRTLTHSLRSSFLRALGLCVPCVLYLSGCKFDLSDVPVTEPQAKPTPGCVLNDGVEGTSGSACVDDYAGVTDTQIAENLCDPSGACANLGDIEGLCTQDPPEKARSLSLVCYLKHSADPDPVKATSECALNGDGERPGLKSTLKGMSEGCLVCYIDVVVCAAQTCTNECLADDASCEECYERTGCLDAFFACSGINSVEEIQAASK